jgi:hypothetical protein
MSIAMEAVVEVPTRVQKEAPDLAASSAAWMAKRPSRGFSRSRSPACWSSATNGLSTKKPCSAIHRSSASSSMRWASAA